MTALKDNKFNLVIVDGSIKNTNQFLKLGEEDQDLVKIVVASFDLEGFTNFFNDVSINRNIVVGSFINGFLSWIDFALDKRKIERPIFSKFTGDGVLLFWETKSQKMTAYNILCLMMTCWNMTSSNPDRYEDEFLKEFIKVIGKRWDCEYPPKLRTGVSLGHALKYTRDGKITDYVSESVNIAVRLTKFHPELYFLAHTDLLIGDEPAKYNFVEKRVNLRGIEKSVSVFVDKDDYDGLSDKSLLSDMS